MPDPPGAASPQLMAFVGVILAASLVAWWGLLQKLLAGESLIPFAPRRPTPWLLGDAGLIVGGWFFFILLFSSLFQALMAGPAVERLEPTPLQIRNLLLATLAANLVTLLVAAVWLRKRGASPEVGLPGRHFADDILLGARVFAVAATPVYGLQMILTQFFPSNHPAIELLGKHADPISVGLVVISAAIVAPLAEEFLFRLVLQGALEGVEQRILDAGRGIAVTPAAPAPIRPAATEAANDPAPADSPGGPADSPGGIDDGLQDKNPAGLSGDEALITALPSGSLGGLPAGVWPIFASSSLFALLHLGHGPDPIPLAIFAAILGYVYRQTHRLTPSIVTHLLLNSCSLVLFWMQPS